MNKKVTDEMRRLEASVGRARVFLDTGHRVFLHSELRLILKRSFRMWWASRKDDKP